MPWGNLQATNVTSEQLALVVLMIWMISHSDQSVVTELLRSGFLRIVFDNPSSVELA